MNKIHFLGIFLLVISMLFSGLSSTAYAQEDLSILLNIALRAQNQIQDQISNTNNVPSDVLAMFEEGKKQVSLLDLSIKNNDISSSKSHFLTAMNTFKKISSLLEQIKPKQQAKTPTLVNDPTSELNRLQTYIQNLKLAAKNYRLDINFDEIDFLVSDAKEKISNEQFDEARITMNGIKQQISIIIKKLNDYAQEQNTQRAKAYAQMYIEQLDRLISAAKSQGMSHEVIDKLENARSKLADASNTRDIIHYVKEILLLKKQFELTKADKLEATLMQVQKIVDRLAKTDGIPQSATDDLQNQLQDVKTSISSGDFERANNLLNSIIDQINLLKKSATT